MQDTPERQAQLPPLSPNANEMIRKPILTSPSQCNKDNRIWDEFSVIRKHYGSTGGLLPFSKTFRAKTARVEVMTKAVTTNSTTARASDASYRTAVLGRMGRLTLEALSHPIYERAASAEPNDILVKAVLRWMTKNGCSLLEWMKRLGSKYLFELNIKGISKFVVQNLE